MTRPGWHPPRLDGLAHAVLRDPGIPDDIRALALRDRWAARLRAARSA